VNTIHAHAGVEPKEWLILFHRTSTPWVSRICWGEFKHVSALAHVPSAGAWVSLSWELGRTRVSLIADGEDFKVWFAAASADADMLRMKAPPFDLGSWRPRIGLTCVSAVKHLLGISGGALRPSSLWRLLIAHGAEIVTHGQPVRAEGGRTETVGV
jgi:hypothetical protein